jgi:hypothetical protein
MGLSIEMQINDMRRDYVNPFHCERGGMLSIITLSGIKYASYAGTVNENTIPVGLALHDQEEVDLFRAVAPWRTHRAYPEYSAYPYLIYGSVITNAVHPHIDPDAVMPGAPAFLAPSGLITCAPTYNSRQIGTFLSFLNQPGLPVPSLGPSVLRVGGNEKIVNPERVLVPTAGWIKINIHIR